MKLTKTHTLYLIILLLASLNVTVVTLFTRHLKEEAILPVVQVTVPNTHLGRFFKEELGLNKEQHNQFRTFRQAYHTNSGQLLSEMQEVRENILKELNKTNPKREKLDKYAEQIGSMHVSLKQLTFDYYLNMQSVLDVDQKERLSAIFQSMLTDHGDVKHPEHEPYHYQSHELETESDSYSEEHIDF